MSGRGARSGSGETGYKCLLRPTAKQAAALVACLDDHRNLYNAALEERREAYRRATFLSVLRAKAESAGRVVVAVNAANTSRTCPDWGHCVRENRVTQADFRCVACGYAGHADVVGATNILRAGLALQAARAA